MMLFVLVVVVALVDFSGIVVVVVVSSGVVVVDIVVVVVVSSGVAVVDILVVVMVEVVVVAAVVVECNWDNWSFPVFLLGQLLESFVFSLIQERTFLTRAYTPGHIGLAQFLPQLMTPSKTETPF